MRHLQKALICLPLAIAIAAGVLFYLNHESRTGKIHALGEHRFTVGNVFKKGANHVEVRLLVERFLLPPRDGGVTYRFPLDGPVRNVEDSGGRVIVHTDTGRYAITARPNSIGCRRLVD